MTTIINKTAIMTLLKMIFNYFREYKLIYIGVVLCNFCCFNFHNVFNDRKGNEIVLTTLIIIFFLISFIFPIVLGLIFTAKCFWAKTRGLLLLNIIHSYIGTILIFTALYYQCSVLGDFNDAVIKKNDYESQINIKKNLCQDLNIMRVADQRAFKGIKPRIWSGYDYPGSNITMGKEHNPDSWHFFSRNYYEDLSVEQIERIVTNRFEEANVIEYQKQNVGDVYIDCLYFSVVCIATVGFGDISPSLWYTKLFTALEVFIGMSIFVFAIGMLFSNWSIKSKDT